MDKPYVITNYSKFGDQELYILADLVYKSLNPNPRFTWAVEVMPNFKTKITTYYTKLQEAPVIKGTGPAAKNIAKKELTDEMRDIAVEVNKQANGNLEMLKSTAFILAKTRSPKGELEKPDYVKVTSGTNAGELICETPSFKDAVMYCFYTAPVPEPADMDDWKLSISTDHKRKIKGFTSGKKYAVRSAYQGTVDTLNYSDTVYIYAQ
jgi:hypothetical protein